MDFKKVLLPAVIGASIAGTATVSSAASLDGDGTWHSRVQLSAQSGVTDSTTMSYRVYTPPGYDGSTALPMVVAVHGCAMPHDDLEKEWDLESYADANNFLIMTPHNNNTKSTATSSRADYCWGYWFDQHQVRGKGEPADIVNGINQVKANYNVDNERVYVTGISSGGAMVTILATTYPDVFAAAASTAGNAYDTESSTVLSESGFKTPQQHANLYSAARGADRDAPILFIASDNDTVQPTRDSLCLGPASMALAFGHSNMNDSCTSNNVATSGDLIAAANLPFKPDEGVSWEYRQWEAEGLPTVAVYNYDGTTSVGTGSLGVGHYWVSDNDTGEYTHNQGIPYMDIAWHFFKDKTLSGNQKPTITLAGDAEEILINNCDAWVEPGFSANDAEDGDITAGVQVSGSVNTCNIGNYTITYSVTDSGGKSDSVDRVVRVLDGTTNTAPTITLTGGSTVTAASGSAWTDPGYSANDKEDGDLTSSVSVTGSVNTSAPGDYTVTYSVTDNGTQLNGATGSTQTTTVTRTVTVVPVCWTAPVGDHLTAGRVETNGTNVCVTVGGGDQLPQYNYSCTFMRDYDGNPSFSISETSAGVFNKVDSCNTPPPPPPADADNDGVADSADQCPNTPAGDTVDANGCTVNTSSCEDHTMANYYHKTAGRAYSSGSVFSPNYFANGSDEAMAGSTWGNTSLYSTDGSTWHVGTCP